VKHDVDVELFYDGVWNSAPAYTRDEIQLSHGRGDEQAQPAPSEAKLTIDNRGGDYNPRNVTSPLYGKIGRNTPVRITVDGVVRFAGEAAEWVPRRAVDGGDAWVALTCNGPTRRLGQGNSPAPSAPRAYIPTTGPVAYWPLEDGPGSQQGAPAVGQAPMTWYYRRAAQAWGQGQLAPWLPPVLKLTTDVQTAQALDGYLSMPGFTTTWSVDWMRSGGLGDQSGVFVFTDLFWYFTRADVPLDGFVHFDTADQEVFIFRGAQLDIAVVPEVYDDNPHHLRLTLTQVGGNILHQLFLDGVEILSGSEAGQTLTRPTRIRHSVGEVAQVPLAVGHTAVWTTAPTLATAVKVAFGRPGETAGRRVERLCAEHSIPFTSTGDLDDTAALGPQYADTLTAIAHEAAAADLGIVTDAVDVVGLHYRTRASVYDQAAALELEFTDAGVAPTLDPAVDDQLVRNDVTAKRRDGSEARALDQDGPLGVDSIGRYDTTVTLNVAGDGFLPSQAGWRLHLGTTDEDRWPRVAVDLDAAPELTAVVAALRAGDLVTIDGLPAEIAGAGRAELLVQGWSETIGSHRRLVTFTCTPAPPWQVSEYEAATGATANKYDTAGSQLAAAVSAVAGTLSVATVIKPLWTAADPEDGFYVIIGGEVMQVTDVSGAASPQTFTVVRSINGVAKAHPAGEAVRLYPTPRYAL